MKESTEHNTERKRLYRSRHYVICKQRTHARMVSQIGKLTVAQAEEYLGCSWAQLLVHLEGIFSTFSDEDRWWPDPPTGNPRLRIFRDYHIDHIKPLNKFPLQDVPATRYVAFNWKNTSLKTPKENAEKGDKYTPVPDDDSLAFRDSNWLPGNFIFTIYEAPSEPIAKQPNPVRYWPIFEKVPGSPPDSSCSMSI